MKLKNIILSTVLSIASCHALAVDNSQIALSNLHMENTPNGMSAIVGYAESIGLKMFLIASCSG
ncbi:Uncharacterised protein [Salmonella enterica subsp. enterica serovar Typhi]|nr:Uncharacterised protein [Salmonella enterica subsp. enterica serovar Typhi]